MRSGDLAMSVEPSSIGAAVVQSCADLDATVTFFRERLGFRLDTIFPADDPTVALISGHGLRIRLENGASMAPATLRLPRAAHCSSGSTPLELTAPNGTRILLVDGDITAKSDPVIPELIIQRASAQPSGAWNEGRAGMRYRDLIPGRWNGHFIASHIQITDGGPVPDYVHHHDVRFQMIYCHRGWVRVVYEDQGPPFVMHPGDCVLQPPGIRHQVLEASDGLEVIEIGAPALHATHADHQLPLPSSKTAVDRVFGGQRFTRHIASRAPWQPWVSSGFEARDLGIAAATDGLARASVARVTTSGAGGHLRHPGGFQFMFVLDGDVTLHHQDRAEHRLHAGDAATIPPGMETSLTDCSNGAEILEITISAEIFSP
jgi:quercetin dioxygenase-like cupin family protein